MKKLCFICFNIEDMGGINRVVSGLCNEFCENYIVHVVSICDTGKEPYYSLNPEIKLYKIKNSPDKRIRKIIINSFKFLKKYLCDKKFDFVFMEGHYVPPIVLPVKIFTKGKFVFCDHGALSNQIKDKKATFFRKLAAKFSDKVVVLTESTKKEYIETFKVHQEKITAIPNFIDENLIKHRKNYDVDSKLILSSGRFTSEKGFDMIPDIAEKVFEKYPDWSWHIYGNGPKYDFVKEKIFEKNLSNKVILKGFADDMYKKYCNYAMFVLPSYREGFALVLLEAKVNGLPTVSFDCVSGPSEIINQNVDGYLIPCYNKEVMTQKICSLIENKKLRKNFSDNSLKDTDRFSKDIIIKMWGKIIENI